MAVIAPNEAQMEQAFEVLRGAGWPLTLAELRLDDSGLSPARMGIVLAAARHVANGGHLDRPDLSGPIREPYKPAPRPHPHHSPARRHGDAVDLKRAASGEKDDD